MALPNPRQSCEDCLAMASDAERSGNLHAMGVWLHMFEKYDQFHEISPHELRDYLMALANAVRQDRIDRA